MVSWPPVARLVRGEVLSLRTREYVQAAVVTGQTNTWIILREILPNALSPDHRAGLADGGDRDPAGILAVVPRPWRSQPDVLGLHGRRRPHRDPPGLVDHASFPASPSCSRCSALNLIGEGLNDALNPRLRAEGR